jgi:uncharacterized protein (TIGR03382 family)
MSHRFASCLCAALLSLALVPAGRAGELTIGNVNSGEFNAFPFSGSYQDTFGADRYQQVYNSFLFGANQVSISSITFYAAGSHFGPNADGTYTLSLSTTAASVNGLDTNMANNVGLNDETFFSGTLPAYPSASGGPMTFTIASPFLYDPSAGNLLLDIQISGVTNDSNAAFVSQSGDFGTDSSRMVNGGASPGTSYGLVTTFGLGTTSVPEPGSLTLAMIGLVAVAGLSRRRRHCA